MGVLFEDVVWNNVHDRVIKDVPNQGHHDVIPETGDSSAAQDLFWIIANSDIGRELWNRTANLDQDLGNVQGRGFVSCGLQGNQFLWR